MSLTEVLIAIFVMAIGMISLLVLFPVGLMNMAEAVKNNRASQAEANANSVADVPFNISGINHNLRSDPHYNPTYGWIFKLLGLYPQLYGAGNWLFNGQDPNCSFAVYVDPIGDNMMGPGQPVGGKINPPLGWFIPLPNILPIGGFQVGIPRAATSSTKGNMAQAKNLFSQEDDVTFYPNGAAVGGPVERGRRYSWAYLLRWPRIADTSVVDMTVILYSGRPTPNLVTVGTSTQNSAELTYMRTLPAVDLRVFRKGETTAIIQKSTVPFQEPWPSPIKPGNWILDGTMVRMESLPLVLPTKPLMVNGFFYHVVSVSAPYVDSTGAEVQELQLDRPAKADGFAAVYLQGVVDVREKSDGRMPAK